MDFWIDLDAQPNCYRIMSDVRLGIEALFAREGVVIAFPKRQVLLEWQKSVKVEMVVEQLGV